MQKTEQLDQQTLSQLREANARRATLVNTFGQIYVRRQELEAELDRLIGLEEEANLSFKSAGQEIQSVLDSLSEKYLNGSLNINEGTITYEQVETEDKTDE